MEIELPFWSVFMWELGKGLIGKFGWINVIILALSAWFVIFMIPGLPRSYLSCFQIHNYGGFVMCHLGTQAPLFKLHLIFK